MAGWWCGWLRSCSGWWMVGDGKAWFTNFFHICKMKVIKENLICKSWMFHIYVNLLESKQWKWAFYSQDSMSPGIFHRSHEMHLHSHLDSFFVSHFVKFVYIYIFIYYFSHLPILSSRSLYMYIYIYTPCLPPRPITPRFLATASWGETFRWWPHWWRVSFCWPGRLMVASVWQELIWGEFLKFAKSSAIGTLKHFFDVTQWHVFFS
jgi:hypothetical protein